MKNRSKHKVKLKVNNTIDTDVCLDLKNSNNPVISFPFGEIDDSEFLSLFPCKGQSEDTSYSFLNSVINTEPSNETEPNNVNSIPTKYYLSSDFNEIIWTALCRINSV